VSERALHHEIQAATALKESLAAYDDEDLLRDTIEGETDLHELIAKVFASIDEDAILLAGIAERMEGLKARKARIEKAVERKRAMIEQAMSIGEIRSLTLPSGTLILASKPRALVVENEADVPSDYWKPQPPKLDKSALKAALKDGASVPGASLDNGGSTLVIRRS